MVKKFLNIFLLVSLLLALSLSVWLFYVSNGKNVGDIKYDTELDDVTFEVCNENRIQQYYNHHFPTSYVGGAKAFRKEIYASLKNEPTSFGTKSGYITFRFIVNCKGTIGRFRVKMIDANIQETTFDITKVDKLKTILKKLTKWNPGVYEGVSLDSYYLIKFKVEDGIITDIF